MPGVRIGHVHLKVANLQRALDFYCGVLGFEVTTTRPGAAFISAGMATTTISASTPGRAWGARLRHRCGSDRPLPYRHPVPVPAAAWPTRCAGFDRRQDPASRAPVTTASARRFICATRIKTASSFIRTGRRTKVAKEAGWLFANVHPPARSARSAGGVGSCECVTAWLARRKGAPAPLRQRPKR